MRNKSPVFVLLVAGALAAMGGLLAKGQIPEGKTTVRLIPQVDRPKLDVAPGWTWLMGPTELRPGQCFGQTSDAGIVSGYSHVDAGGNGLRVYFVQAGQRQRVDPPAYHLVIFDAAGQRYLPKLEKAGGLGNRDTQLDQATFTLGADVLPPGNAAYIAAERVTSKVK